MSLVELLVVLAIIGILLALLLPAAQHAREAARRMQCSSNLRQIGLAVHQYEATFQVLPAGNRQGYSYLAAILPYVEQQALYSKLDWSVYAHSGPSDQIREHVNVFVCPSDGAAVGNPIAANYAGNIGYDAQINGYNGAFDARGAVVADPTEQVAYLALASIADGLSQTSLLSEFLVSDPTQSARRRNWLTAECFEPGHFDEFLHACLSHEFATFPDGTVVGSGFRGRPWLEGQAGTTLYTHALTPNKISCVNCGMSPYGAYTASSNHDQGVVACRADGSVHFVSDGVELQIWRAAGTRNGGD